MVPNAMYDQTLQWTIYKSSGEVKPTRKIHVKLCRYLSSEKQGK